MGFTRSTTNTSVHQGMPDYPSSEGYTTTQLKEAFDAPAEGLQSDLNGLMSELENVLASGNIGANKLTEDDTSGATVQEKLDKIYGDLQGISQGAIPDNSITSAKLDSTFKSTLAVKDGTLQSGLNSEQLGGKDLAYILGEILAKSYSTGTFNSNGSTGSPNYAVTINVGFNPTAMVYINHVGANTDVHKPAIGIIIGTHHYYNSNNTWRADTAIISNNTVTIGKFDTGLTYSYLAFR